MSGRKDEIGSESDRSAAGLLDPDSPTEPQPPLARHTQRDIPLVVGSAHEGDIELERPPTRERPLVCYTLEVDSVLAITHPEPDGVSGLEVLVITELHPLLHTPPKSR